MITCESHVITCEWGASQGRRFWSLLCPEAAALCYLKVPERKAGWRRGQNVPSFRDKSRLTNRETRLLDNHPGVGLKILSQLYFHLIPSMYVFPWLFASLKYGYRGPGPITQADLIPWSRLNYDAQRLWFLDQVLAHWLCPYLGLVSLLAWTSQGTEALTTVWHLSEGLWDRPPL